MQIHPGLKIESSKIKELDTLLGRINTADDFFKIIESLKSMEKDRVEQNSVEKAKTLTIKNMEALTKTK